jgi:hypothetical protein
MYRLDTAMFDRIQESETASPALKRKLKFLVAVFNHPSAEITLAEVNPAYVSARYESMKSQVGFRMNASALKTLLTSFRICFNVMRIEAAQRQAAITGQRSFERAAMRKAEFSNLRQLNLFGQKRTREEEDDGDAEMSEASSASGGEGSAKMLTVAARSKYLLPTQLRSMSMRFRKCLERASGMWHQLVVYSRRSTGAKPWWVLVQFSKRDIIEGGTFIAPGLWNCSRKGSS